MFHAHMHGAVKLLKSPLIFINKINHIGMHIAQQTTESMGGKLWFESSEGKGTTFYLSLPISNGAQKQEKSVQARGENDILPAL